MAKSYLLEEIPKNITDYCEEHACILRVDAIHESCCNGYGHRFWHRVTILMPFDYCPRCGYHSITNRDVPNDKQCAKCTYGRKGMMKVFDFLEEGEKVSLEEAFEQYKTGMRKEPTNIWADGQEYEYFEPVGRRQNAKGEKYGNNNL